MDVDASPRGDDERTGSAPRVLGRYRLVAELGRGSTSIVYLAAVDGPAGFNKFFALKVLRRALAAEPPSVAMFLAEARIGAQFNHPNVVSTLEIDEREELPFIVMEFLDGEPMQRLVTAARMAFTPLPLHMHLAIISGALEGLAHAHAAVGTDGAPLCVVHRDVSPHNVFVTNSGTAKLLDFGFAQSVDSPNTMLSSAARVAYMSPEQADRGVVDLRADLFAVGVMAWEAVTRRRFWSDEASQTEILLALRSRQLPPSRVEALGKVADGLRTMIVKATAPDPDERYPTAAAFQADLRRILIEITPPTFNLGHLGQRVTTLFAADRARLQRAIDEQRDLAKAPQLERTPRSQPPQALAATPEIELARSPGSIPPPVPATPPPPMAAEPVFSLDAGRGSDPLPSFPLPPVERRGWRAHPYRIGAASLAVAILIGLGISVVTARGGSASPWVTVAPAPTASGSAGAEVSGTHPLGGAAAAPSKLPADPTPVQAPNEALSAAVAAPTSAPQPAQAAVLEPRVRGSWAGRSRTAPQPPVAAPREATSGTDSPVVKPTRTAGDGTGGSAVREAPIRISETAQPLPARPPHPIDSMNPYGP